MRNGLVELAFGVTGEVANPLLVEATLDARGGRMRFFWAAASRRLTSLGLSRRSSILFVLGALKNGLEGCGGKGEVNTKGWVWTMFTSLAFGEVKFNRQARLT
jgi:hypothetical protein